MVLLGVLRPNLLPICRYGICVGLLVSMAWATASRGATGQDDKASVATMPHSLSQAYLRMFSDTVLFALNHEPTWARNLQAAALWRAGLAELPSDCFLGKKGRCLSKGRTDRELLLEQFQKALPAGTIGWSVDAGIERDTVVRGLVDLMALLLASRIDSTYQRVQSTDERGVETPPELVYSTAGAVGRVARDNHFKMIPLDGISGSVGFLVLERQWQPTGDRDIGIVLAHKAIKIRRKGPVPDSLRPVSAEEFEGHMADPQTRERVRRTLVPPGRRAGASLHLVNEGNRAVELLNEGRLEQAIAIFETARAESDNPEFNQYLDDSLQKAKGQFEYLEAMRLEAAGEFSESEELLGQAASRGHPAALLTMGVRLSASRVDAHHRILGCAYLRLAASSGEPGVEELATARLVELENLLTEEELAQVSEEVKYLRPEPLFAEDIGPDSQELVTLRGTMTATQGPAGPSRIWAKGNKMRTEMAIGTQTVVSIQLGNVIYMYKKGGETGQELRIAPGLAALGLIEQISEIRANGKKRGSKEIDGVVYHEYVYEKNAPQETAIVLFAADTFLPKTWLSLLEPGQPVGTAAEFFFENMEANVEISDEMFELPRDVTFSEYSVGKK